jgi:hypothetical protein
LLYLDDLFYTWLKGLLLYHIGRITTTKSGFRVRALAVGCHLFREGREATVSWLRNLVDLPEQTNWVADSD